MFWRSIMYVPGNTPSMIQSSMIYGADAIVLDLEDSVEESEKDSARNLVSCALKMLDFSGTDVFVRTNSVDSKHFQRDLRAVAGTCIYGIRVPKVQKAQEIVYIDQSITEIENELSLPGGIIKFMVSIESALGVINIKEICQASTRLIGVAFGAEDFTYDMGVKRTKEGNELAFARSTLALTARAYGKIAIDCVFSDTKDPEGLRKDCEIARSFGMTGKSVIHPGQIEVVNKSFSPSDQEIGQARRVIEQYEKLGCPGVFSFEGNMVDLPVLKKYQRIYELYGRDKGE